MIQLLVQAWVLLTVTALGALVLLMGAQTAWGLARRGVAQLRVLTGAQRTEVPAYVLAAPGR